VISRVLVSQGKVCTCTLKGGKLIFLMAYLLNNNSTKNYCNRTTTVKISVEGWVEYFFTTQCRTNTSTMPSQDSMVDFQTAKYHETSASLRFSKK